MVLNDREKEATLILPLDSPPEYSELPYDESTHSTGNPKWSRFVDGLIRMTEWSQGTKDVTGDAMYWKHRDSQVELGTRVTQNWLCLP